MIKFNEVTWYSKWGAIILFLLVVPVLSFYLGTQYEAVKQNSSEIPILIYQQASTTPNQKDPSDTFFTDPVKQKNPEAQSVDVIGRGDINQDGYEDAIVTIFYCGAGCEYSLSVVLNNKNQSVSEVGAEFDGIEGSPSAFKSLINTVVIKDGIISITGSGFDCDTDSEMPITNVCKVDEDNQWLESKTIQYRFDGTKIVRLTKL